MPTRSLVEQALSKLLDEARQPRTFSLPDLSFGVGGLTPEFENASWDEVLAEIYPMPRIRTSEDA